MVSQSAQVASVTNGVLTLAFDNAGLAARFAGSAHAENVALAVRETLGLHVRVEATQGPSTPGRAAASASAAAATVAATGTGAPATPTPAGPGAPSAPQATSATEAEPPPWDEPPADEEISPDDDAAPDARLTGADVVAQMLGGTVVDP